MTKPRGSSEPAEPEAHVGAPKPRHRPRSREVVGIDGTSTQATIASVISSLDARCVADRRSSNTPAIAVTIGRATRLYLAYITSASANLDAPSTITLYSSTLGDLAGIALDDPLADATGSRAPARTVLVDSLEFNWQRARVRQAGHLLLPVDGHLLGGRALEHWLWRRLGAGESSPADRHENVISDAPRDRLTTTRRLIR